MQKKDSQHIDKKIQHLLKTSGFEKPSLAFTENVLNLVKNEKVKKIKYKPILSPRAWFTVSAIVLIFICLIINVDSAPKNSLPVITNITNYMTDYTNWFINTINSISKVTVRSMLPLIIPISFLLLWQIDRILQKYLQKM